MRCRIAGKVRPARYLPSVIDGASMVILRTSKAAQVNHQAVLPEERVGGMLSSFTRPRLADYLAIVVRLVPKPQESSPNGSGVEVSA